MYVLEDMQCSCYYLLINSRVAITLKGNLEYMTVFKNVEDADSALSSSLKKKYSSDGSIVHTRLAQCMSWVLEKSKVFDRVGGINYINYIVNIDKDEYNSGFIELELIRNSREINNNIKLSESLMN